MFPLPEASYLAALVRHERLQPQPRVLGLNFIVRLLPHRRWLGVYQRLLVNGRKVAPVPLVLVARLVRSDFVLRFQRSGLKALK